MGIVSAHDGTCKIFKDLTAYYSRSELTQQRLACHAWATRQPCSSSSRPSDHRTGHHLHQSPHLPEWRIGHEPVNRCKVLQQAEQLLFLPYRVLHSKGTWLKMTSKNQGRLRTTPMGHFCRLHGFWSSNKDKLYWTMDSLTPPSNLITVQSCTYLEQLSHLFQLLFELADWPHRADAEFRVLHTNVCGLHVEEQGGREYRKPLRGKTSMPHTSK